MKAKKHTHPASLAGALSAVTLALGALAPLPAALAPFAGIQNARAQTNPCVPQKTRSANPCAPQKTRSANPCAPQKTRSANPCAPSKAANPCAPKAGTKASKPKCDQAAPKNPCAPKPKCTQDDGK
ncbi:MAG: hypothetical protein ABFC67_10965 [Mizugakiibacter sp.]|uniref:hypothetical protein n=1 Tax=Mizugakiibacter sp. TaxID=1972610 RepID=UPI0031BCEFEB|nr:hypothetical protein [Xanthomonadaceae bacterium]